jgi:hypothetical protein
MVDLVFAGTPPKDSEPHRKYKYNFILKLQTDKALPEGCTFSVKVDQGPMVFWNDEQRKDLPIATAYIPANTFQSGQFLLTNSAKTQKHPFFQAKPVRISVQPMDSQRVAGNSFPLFVPPDFATRIEWRTVPEHVPADGHLLIELTATIKDGLNSIPRPSDYNYKRATVSLIRRAITGLGTCAFSPSQPITINADDDAEASWKLSGVGAFKLSTAVKVKAGGPAMIFNCPVQLCFDCPYSLFLASALCGALAAALRRKGLIAVFQGFVVCLLLVLAIFYGGVTQIPFLQSSLKVSALPIWLWPVSCTLCLFIGLTIPTGFRRGSSRTGSQGADSREGDDSNTGRTAGVAPQEGTASQCDQQGKLDVMDPSAGNAQSETNN